MIRAFAMPETHQARLAWLERELVGPNLPRLATELAAVHGDGGLDSALLEDGRLINQGLQWLDAVQLEYLLRQPQTLVALQRRVLAEDSRYWASIEPPTEGDGDGGAIAGSVGELLEASRRPATPPPPKASLRESQPGGRRSIAWSMAASLATAAALVLTADVWRPAADNIGRAADPAGQGEPLAESATPPPAAEPIVVRADQAWGFGKFVATVRTDEEQLGPPLTREAYLRQLADAAEAWRNKRPGDRAALAQRLGEFRMGCSALLLADHAALPEADRRWLRDRCRSWADAIDRRLAEVESGGDTQQVLGLVDSTIGSIAEALRGRGDSPPPLDA